MSVKRIDEALSQLNKNANTSKKNNLYEKVESKNKSFGFFGTLKSDYQYKDSEAAKLFDFAAKKLSQLKKVNVDVIRQFLDSKLGRHLSDSLSFHLSSSEPSLKEGQKALLDLIKKRGTKKIGLDRFLSEFAPADLESKKVSENLSTNMILELTLGSYKAFVFFDPKKGYTIRFNGPGDFNTSRLNIKSNEKRWYPIIFQEFKRRVEDAGIKSKVDSRKIKVKDYRKNESKQVKEVRKSKIGSSKRDAHKLANLIAKKLGFQGGNVTVGSQGNIYLEVGDKSGLKTAGVVNFKKGFITLDKKYKKYEPFFDAVVFGDPKQVKEALKFFRSNQSTSGHPTLSVGRGYELIASPSLTSRAEIELTKFDSNKNPIDADTFQVDDIAKMLSKKGINVNTSDSKWVSFFKKFYGFVPNKNESKQVKESLDKTSLIKLNKIVDNMFKLVLSGSKLSRKDKDYAESFDVIEDKLNELFNMLDVDLRESGSISEDARGFNYPVYDKSGKMVYFRSDAKMAVDDLSQLDELGFLFKMLGDDKSAASKQSQAIKTHKKFLDKLFDGVDTSMGRKNFYYCFNKSGKMVYKTMVSKLVVNVLEGDDVDFVMAVNENVEDEKMIKKIGSSIAKKAVFESCGKDHKQNEVKISDIIKRGDRDSEVKVRQIIKDMRKKNKSDREIEKYLKPMVPGKLIKDLLSEQDKDLEKYIDSLYSKFGKKLDKHDFDFDFKGDDLVITFDYANSPMKSVYQIYSDGKMFHLDTDNEGHTSKDKYNFSNIKRAIETALRIG